MKFPAPAWIALALTAGCLRFGYGADLSELDAGSDSAVTRRDGSVPEAGPAADGGGSFDGGGMDAAIGGDGGVSVRDAGSGALDAGRIPDAGLMDAAARDSGSSDAAPMDSSAGDTSTPDTGTSDSGPLDPDADPSWTEDCLGVPGVLFCDDFEDGLSKWSYEVQERGSTTVTTDYKRSGSYSMRASTSASTSSVQSKARRAVRAFGHRTTGELWARFYYYLPSSVALTDKFSISTVSEAEDPFFGFLAVITSNGVGVEQGGLSRSAGVAFPRDQWVCVEMEAQLDASSGTMAVYVNGTAASAIIGRNSVPAQGYTLFEVGVHYANFNQGPITAYVDDVMLGTRRIGCN